MNQDLYAHMNNKRKKIKINKLIKLNLTCRNHQNRTLEESVKY
jgi:hypothetical protein